MDLLARVLGDASSILSSPLSTRSSSPHSGSSSPLSFLSRSPSPLTPVVGGYPSPSSSGSARSRSSSLGCCSMATGSVDGPPQRKRRRLNDLVPLQTTRHLDLHAYVNTTGEVDTQDSQAKVARLVRALHQKRKIVVIAGAGISVSAGIPDFRSSDGLFNTLRSEHKLKASGKHLFDASVYKTDENTTSFHDMVRKLSHLTNAAAPTPFHHMLATLAAEGRLMRLYSQNVDGLDASLGPLATSVPLSSKGPWPKTIQLHGGLGKMVCTKCNQLSNFDGDLFEGPEAPCCPQCYELDRVRTEMAGKRSHGVGRLRPRMVLYNEYNPDQDAIGAVSAADLKSRPDAVIVVGTSLKVPGIRRLAREFCQVTKGRKDGFTAWVSLGPEPSGVEFKDCWDLVVNGTSDDVAQFAGLPRWDDAASGDDVTKEELASAKALGLSHVELGSPEERQQAIDRVQGIITPEASPRKQSPALLESTNLSPTPMKTKATFSKPNQPKLSRSKAAAKPRTKKPKTAVQPRISAAFSTSKAVPKTIITPATKGKVGGSSSAANLESAAAVES